MKLVPQAGPCLQMPLATLEDLMKGDRAGYIELCGASRQAPAPVAWEGNGDLERYRRYTSELAPLRLLSLPRVSLFACGLMADSEGRIYDRGEFHADEVYAPDHPVNLNTGAYQRAADSGELTLSDDLATRYIAEPCLVLVQCGWNIYGHWLLDILPKIPLCSLLPETVKVVLPVGIADWQLQYLQLLGVSDEQVVTYDPGREILQLERAICVSHLRQYYALNPYANIAFDRVLAQAGASCDKPAGQKLYVSRRGLATRKQNFVNREEVEALLEGRGFRVVEPESMDLLDQVRCFAGASVVVGEQGSGLHNTAFSPRGTRVICLHSENAQYFAQAGLGHIRSQPTGFIFGRYRQDLDVRGSNRVFEIDSRVLSRVLDALGDGSE